MRIRVNPDDLNELSRDLIQVAASLEQTESRLRSAMNSLMWEFSGRESEESRVMAATQQANLLIRGAEEMSVFLRESAVRFEEADEGWSPVGRGVLGAAGTGLGSWAAIRPIVGIGSLLFPRVVPPITSGIKWFLGLIQTPPAGSPPAPQPPSKAGTRTLPDSRQPDVDRTPPYTLQFDGENAAPGTTSETVWQPVAPAVTSDENNRSRERYADVLNQFAVESNRRYRQRDTSGDGENDTFCNIFVWDATSAMGAPVPHWIDRNTGQPYPDELVAGKAYSEVAKHAWEADANYAARWLRDQSAAAGGDVPGWHAVSAQEAQEMANEGRPTVAAWDSGARGGPGHIAMVRPGSYDEVRGPEIAQAGGKNFNQGRVADGFGPGKDVKYYVYK